MVNAAGLGLDTPRTGLGDATYLNQPDFDISQEQSFQSPSKDNNLLQQLQAGRRGPINLKTPRGSRALLSSRQNISNAFGGGEFTPLLKSATRNSAFRLGKENVPRTPAFLKPGGLDNVAEELSPLPPMGSSIYGDDTQHGSYAGTPMPILESSSPESTPMAMLPRRGEGAGAPGVLQDGNQLSLREQENVIDKIEKENFGLKLKIHFLEEALRKAGPGFSEATVRENTELKVDKVTMQHELKRYRKTLTSAERELETYREQMVDMQENIKRKYADEGQREELDRVRKLLEDREAEVQDLKGKLEDADGQEADMEKLRDNIADLEYDLREKDRIIEEREDEVEGLKAKVEEDSNTIEEIEDAMKAAQRHALELEENAQTSNDRELADAKDTIDDLQRDLSRVRSEAQEAKDECHEAVVEKARAEADLEELQEELANKSITTRGLSRQIEEKANRLQDDLEDLREKYSSLEDDHKEKNQQMTQLQKKVHDFEETSEALTALLRQTQDELRQKSETKDLLQARHVALTNESSGLQRDLAKARADIQDLEDSLDAEKAVAASSEREIRDQFTAEFNRLQDEIEDLRAEAREKERLHSDDSDKWESEKRSLGSQREMLQEQATSLKRTIEKLQQAEGTLTSKESKMQEALHSEKERHEQKEALLTRQNEELQADVQTRRIALDDVKSELSATREELRLCQRAQRTMEEKVESLEDEIEVLQSTLDDESERAREDVSTARRESDDLRRQIHTLKQDLSKAETAFADARTDLDKFHADMKAGMSSQDQVNVRLHDVEVQLATARQDKRNAQDQLASLHLEHRTTQTKLAEITAERDEFRSQLRDMKQQEEETFRLDVERIELRTAKSKLDGEVTRLREEKNTLMQQFEAELERASVEEARLSDEILSLRKQQSPLIDNESKRTIQHLEDRIKELESGLQDDAPHELSLLRHDLSSARQKERDYQQRETAQRDVLRNLKRQISELERKAHEAEISRLQVSSSPQSSSSGSARKNELLELRRQLATAHVGLKELRIQVKDLERESARKVAASDVALETATDAWEIERDQLQHDLDAASATITDLTSKNTLSTTTISRLRSKIERLERELSAERKNVGDDRTMALERMDLHDMLREAQSSVEELTLVVKERDHVITRISGVETELRAQLLRVREERALQRERALGAEGEMAAMEDSVRRLKAESAKVRFVNTSVSEHGGRGHSSGQTEVLVHEAEEREKRHGKELRGLAMQIEWLRARCRREEGLRADAAYAKRFMLLQVELFGAWYVSLSRVVSRFPPFSRPVTCLPNALRDPS